MRDVAERTGRRAPHLLIGPWTHSSYLGNAGQLDFGPAASGAVLDGRAGLNAEHLRWYDATLKGDEQALADTAPVRLFVMGENRWRSFDHYPVPGARVEDWHLQPGGGLDRASPPDSPPDTYVYDPAGPRPHPRRLDDARADAAARPVRPARDRSPAGRAVLHQRTAGAALHGARRGVGDPVRGVVRPDTDFVARLVDVHPDGRAFNVADGILRASTRDTYPEPGVSAPRRRSPLRARRALPVLHRPLGHRVARSCPGHRIRVDVTSSSHPRWVRHTNTAGGPCRRHGSGQRPGNRSSTTHDARAGST